MIRIKAVMVFLFLFLAELTLHCASGLSVVVASGNYSSWWCQGFSSWWLLLLRSIGSRAWASVIVAYESHSYPIRRFNLYPSTLDENLGEILAVTLLPIILFYYMFIKNITKFTVITMFKRTVQ